MNHVEGRYLPQRNFGGLGSPFSDLDYARAVILPVPYDSTTEWHSGTRNGPKAIVEASFYLEWFDIDLGCEIHTAGIHTLPELEPAMDGPKSMCERVFTTVTSLLEKSKFVVVLGGEHSISYGSVKAHRQKYANLSVLQLDAHSDLRNSYLGTEFSHACVMRRIIDICPITQVGIRSTSREEIDFITARELKPVFMGKQGKALPVSEIISSLAESVYITIDLDVFDPSIMSAVGTPEPGGLLWQETIDLLYAVAAKRRIVGFDLVELCPGQGPESCSFLAAKLAYKLIGFALMQSR